MKAKPSPRIGRINDVLHRELAKLIREKCKDPRLGMVTIASVEVANNLEHARVYITVLEDEKITPSLMVLNRASGFLRTELARVALLRIVPKLRFIYDDSVRNSMRISSLIDAVACANANEYS